MIDSIKAGPETAAFDATMLDNVPPGDRWACVWPPDRREVEVLIDGDEDAPYDRLVDIARLILPKLGVFERVADAYIRRFIKPEEHGFTGRWSVQSLVIAVPRHRRPGHSEIELGLAIGGDDYGTWAVRFLYDPAPHKSFRPHFFSRRQG